MSEMEQGLVLICDHQGLIQKVLRNDLGLSEAVSGELFMRFLNSASRMKAMSFLAELNEQGSVPDWELDISGDKKPLTLHFAGSRVDEGLLITAAVNSQTARRLYEDLLRINNEQTNLLRAVIKQKVEIKPATPDHSQYEEISRLNNELVNMQRELSKKNAELASLNALKNQFLGMAAHDLRNPLQGILYYSEFLLEDPARLEADQLEFITVIHDQSQYMTSLVNDLLDVATIESGKLQLDLQPVDLAKLAQTNLVRNRLFAGRKNITLDFEVGNIPMSLLDAAKMEQVLDNLTTNAIKYSRPGSHVHIRLRVAGTEILLSVQDEGPGIPPAELDLLFKPFQRTSVKSTGGEKSSGLGLVIAKRIVNGHAGRIWVESQVGIGSTFFVAIPVHIK
jgi:signal transduction histidine kinase